jgi:hypothetical protein
VKKGGAAICLLTWLVAPLVLLIGLIVNRIPTLPI